jgi:hypothetical protein
MTHWRHYFHFPAGAAFHINGPFGYDGKGQVKENSGNRLALRLDLDAWGKAPAFHAVVTSEYHGEGLGNRLVVEEDGKPPREDKNAKVRSDDGSRLRSVESVPLTFSLGFENPKEIDLDIRIGGTDYDFDLTI